LTSHVVIYVDVLNSKLNDIEIRTELTQVDVAVLKRVLRHAMGHEFSHAVEIIQRKMHHLFFFKISVVDKKIW